MNVPIIGQKKEVIIRVDLREGQLAVEIGTNGTNEKDLIRALPYINSTIMITVFKSRPPENVVKDFLARIAGETESQVNHRLDAEGVKVGDLISTKEIFEEKPEEEKVVEPVSIPEEE